MPQKKLLVVGPAGPTGMNSDHWKVTRISWLDLMQVSLSDFDAVIFLMTATPILKPRTSEIILRINANSVANIIGHGGEIIFLGPPQQFGEALNQMGHPYGLVSILEMFGLRFSWDEASGDALVPKTLDTLGKPFESYLSTIKAYRRALLGVSVQNGALGGLVGIADSRPVTTSFIDTRYGRPVAFGIRIRGASQWSGPLIYLPVAKDLEASLELLLETGFGINLGKENAPEWTVDVEVVGERPQQEKLAIAEKALELAAAAATTARNAWIESRRDLELLYFTSTALESSVANALVALGGVVCPPKRSGVEDFRLTITVNGSPREALVEVKSTGRDAMEEEALKQIHMWHGSAVADEGIDFGKLVVASNAVGKAPRNRPPAFGANWLSRASILAIKALSVSDVYRALALSKSHQPYSDFWNDLWTLPYSEFAAKLTAVFNREFQGPTNLWEE